jgi:SAM-dependent MidA family methyltransferase
VKGQQVSVCPADIGGRQDESLPIPTTEEQQLSGELTRLIISEIDNAGGGVDFSRFMSLSLYAPGLGYYASGRQKFGSSGDFITAPELGDVLARCLARQCEEILNSMDGGDIVEAGAGSGALAAELLLELERLGRLPQQYLILELSTTLRAHQRETLQCRAPHLSARVHWIDALPPTIRGIVIGNEVLDAMPVERFRIAADGTIVQLQVGHDGSRFVWREREPDVMLSDRVAPLELPADYTSEVGFQAEAWVRSVAERVERGVLLLTDYGFPRAEFYHPDRASGTLMCHYRHRAHVDPLILAGLQDLTAHVDFTAVAQAAREVGLELLGFTSQGMFLLSTGLGEIAATANPTDTRTQTRLAHEISTLTSPAEMGELFKVIALGRGIESPLAGFALRDRRHVLAPTS